MKVSIKFIVIVLESVLVFTLSTMLLILSLKNVEIPAFDHQGPEMLLRDWNVKPLTQVTIATENGLCPSGYFPMFTQKWPGTVEGCLVEGDLVLTTDEYFDEFLSDFDAPECEKIPANPAVIQERTMPD